MKKKLFIVMLVAFCIFSFEKDNSIKIEKKVTRSYLREANLKIISEKYYIDNQLIQPVSLKSTKDSFLQSFEATSGDLNLVCDNTTGYVGTDCLLQTFQDSTTTSEYGIVVYGDVTGDGLGTITDVVKMITYVEKEKGLDTNAKKMSTDIDGDEKISLQDVKIYGDHFLEDKLIEFPDSTENVQTKIELSTTSVVIEKNNSKQVVATTNKGNTAIVDWKSNNTDIVVVDNTGLLTGISGGETTVVVSAADGTKKEIGVKVVIPVTGIMLSENVISMKKGETKSLIAKVSPSDATNPKVIWSSSNENIVKVNASGVLTAMSGGTANITVTTEDGNFKISCVVTVLAPATSISLDDVTIKKGSSITLDPRLSPAGSFVNGFVWSSSDESIATVDQKGKVIGVEGGTAKITVKTIDGSLSATATVNVAMVANVNFKNIDNCENMSVISTTTTSNNSTAKLHSCVSDYTFHRKKQFIQNFAITKEYIYFMTPYNGAWTFPSNIESNGEEAEFKKIAANHVVRISRADNTYQMTYFEYAGHGQSFDVADKTITGSSNDVLYLNAFAYMYDTTLNGVYRYGARYRGVSYTSFRSNYNVNGAVRHPGVSIAIGSGGMNLGMLRTQDYQVNGTFDQTSYYNDVLNVGQNSNYLTNPEVAVDEKNNRIAFVASNNVYVYNLSEFKVGLISGFKSFTKTGGKQGVELYGNYLYQWGDGSTGHKILRKYNINTGVLVETLDFDISDYYADKGWTGYEAEGISIYNGKVYVVVSGWKCKDEACTTKTNQGYNDLFMISGV